MTKNAISLHRNPGTIFFLSLCILIFSSCNPRVARGIRRNDLKKDVEIVTDRGTMIARLSDSTPIHRDNFIRLVKSHFYDGISFHRVIKGFMIQAGDPRTKTTRDSVDKTRDSVDKRNDKIPAEFRQSMFHHKGVLAAAREGDASNPSKGSSYSQFYLVQGRIHTDISLDSIQTFRLNGRKLPLAHRDVYKTLGGSPHLDQNYTIFGELVSGLDVIDKIADVKTSGKEGGDRPTGIIRIRTMRLVKRK